jgi:hypothetical protein
MNPSCLGIRSPLLHKFNFYSWSSVETSGEDAAAKCGRAAASLELVTPEQLKSWRHSHADRHAALRLTSPSSCPWRTACPACLEAAN